jgi:REP element-mobilizing transposase RayT
MKNATLEYSMIRFRSLCRAISESLSTRAFGGKARDKSRPSSGAMIAAATIARRTDRSSLCNIGNLYSVCVPGKVSSFISKPADGDTQLSPDFSGKCRISLKESVPLVHLRCDPLLPTAAHPVTFARKSLISLRDTPYYHVVARCVRRAWLWGIDEYAGRDYSHRKHWVLKRLQQLSRVFAVDICAYAVMSNHYHLVVHVDRAQARRWTAQEVIARWSQLFTCPELIKRWQQAECGAAEQAAAEVLIERWRLRLHDVSWYMRCLNEHLARRANAEDGCKGRFWEGRFKSQALLDEAGLLTAMVYVDLNPIRADVAATPEESQFTSIQARIHTLCRPSRRSTSKTSTTDKVPLLDFRQAAPRKNRPVIPFSLPDYLSLVDWTGRVHRAGKHGAIDRHLPAIAERLNLDPEAWLRMMQPRGNAFGRAIGRLDRLRLHARTLKQAWVQGLSCAQQIYRTV